MTTTCSGYHSRGSTDDGASDDWSADEFDDGYHELYDAPESSEQGDIDIAERPNDADGQEEVDEIYDVPDDAKDILAAKDSAEEDSSIPGSGWNFVEGEASTVTKLKSAFEGKAQQDSQLINSPRSTKGQTSGFETYDRPKNWKTGNPEAPLRPKPNGNGANETQLKPPVKEGGRPEVARKPNALRNKWPPSEIQSEANVAKRYDSLALDNEMKRNVANKLTKALGGQPMSDWSEERANGGSYPSQRNVNIQRNSFNRNPENVCPPMVDRSTRPHTGQNSDEMLRGNGRPSRNLRMQLGSVKSGIQETYDVPRSLNGSIQGSKENASLPDEEEEYIVPISDHQDDGSHGDSHGVPFHEPDQFSYNPQQNATPPLNKNSQRARTSYADIIVSPIGPNAKPTFDFGRSNASRPPTVGERNIDEPASQQDYEVPDQTQLPSRPIRDQAFMQQQQRSQGKNPYPEPKQNLSQPRSNRSVMGGNKEIPLPDNVESTANPEVQDMYEVPGDGEPPPVPGGRDKRPSVPQNVRKVGSAPQPAIGKRGMVKPPRSPKGNVNEQGMCPSTSLKGGKRPAPLPGDTEPEASPEGDQMYEIPVGEEPPPVPDARSRGAFFQQGVDQSRSATQTTILNRGSVQQPAVPNRGSKQQPAVSSRGSKQQPAVSSRGNEQQPAIPNRGSVQQPAVSSRGNEQQPAIPNRGSVQQPAVSRRGNEQQPAIPNRGGVQQPAVSSRGNEQQPAIPNRGNKQQAAVSSKGSMQQPAVKEDDMLEEPQTTYEVVDKEHEASVAGARCPPDGQENRRNVGLSKKTAPYSYDQHDRLLNETLVGLTNPQLTKPSKEPQREIKPRPPSIRKVPPRPATAHSEDGPILDLNELHNAVRQQPPRPAKDSKAAVLPKEPDKMSLERQPWYHGDLGRNETEAMLKKLSRDGAFIVRNTTKVDGYTISIYYQGEIRHLHIVRKENKYHLGSSDQQFENVVQLVNHFKRTPIELKKGGKTNLTVTIPAR